MNFEQVTAYLEEKFGIVLDWTSETVLPMLKELAHRVATVQITKECILNFFMIIILIGGAIYLSKFFKSVKTKDTNGIIQKGIFCGWEAIDAEILTFWVIGAMISVVVVMVLSIIRIIEWSIIPEVRLFEYVSNLLD